MRLTWILVLGGLAEIGWVAVWLLSAGLSHSAVFTQAYLDDQPLARTLVESFRTLFARPDGPEAAVVLAIAFAWLGAVYLGLLVVLHRRADARPRATLAAVVVGSVVFQATLISMPGLFSQDVFGYVVYGRIADAYGLNPYVWPPSAIEKDPLVAWVAEVWRTYACPYGPLWVDVQMRLAHLLGDLGPVQQALAYRGLASGAFVASLGLAWRGLGRVVPLDSAGRLTAFAALAWNPLVLLELVGSAHNDVLMVAASLLAIVPLLGTRRFRRLAHLGAGVGFTLGALVKYLSGLGLVWVLVAAAAGVGSRRARLGRAGLVGLASLAIFVAVSAPWLELPDSLDPLLNETAGVGYVNALPDHLALGIAERASIAFGSPEADTRELARLLERVVVLAVFGLVLAGETRRVWREADQASIVRATARTSLVFILVVSSSLQPWYFALPLALAVLLGWRECLTRVAVAYSVLGLPALYLAYYLREQTPEVVYVVYALAPLLPLLVSLPRWRLLPIRRIAPVAATFSFLGLLRH